MTPVSAITCTTNVTTATAEIRPRGPQHRAGCGRRSCREVGFCSRQRPLQRAEDEVMNLTAVAEADFEFLGMRVDVDELRVECEVKHVSGVTAAIKHVPIGNTYRVHQQPVAHIPVVHEPELLVRLPARRG